MTSINTNVAAQQALRTLQSTNTQLDATQNRISTGLKIGEAKDNAAYWSISTTLKSDNKALGTVKDALNLGAATVDVAYQGFNEAKSVLDEIKSKLTAASTPGIDRTKIQDEINSLRDQLTSIASSSSFSGENWLQTSDVVTDSASVVASFNRNSDNEITIGKIDIDRTGMALINGDGTGILGGAAAEAQAEVPATGTVGEDDYVAGTPAVAARDASGIFAIDLTADMTTAEIEALITTVSTASDGVVSQASKLGAVAARIDMQQSFVSNLMDTIDKGVSGLVDADMNEESTRLQALQVKQQLGVQALSIANQSAQNVMRLFQ